MTEENVFQERFLRLIGEKSLRQVEKETGITAGALSHYGTAKRSPTGEMLKKLAQYFCVSIDYLLGISDDPQPRPNLSAMSNEELVLKLRNLGYDVKPINPEELRSIPIPGRVTAGTKNPVEAIEYIQGWVDTDLPASVEFALRVTGDSMEPLIPAGSIVFVDKSKTARNGSICVVIINGSDAVVKRTYFDPNGVILKSENIRCEPAFIDRDRWESECRIVGVVVRHQVDHV
jgi:repressor LexA